MKRILTLILALTMLLSCMPSVSADSIGLFKGMEVLSELTDRAETDYVRRDEFAAVAAVLMGVNATGTAATKFADVTEDNAYGAAISAVSGAGIMNGTGLDSFAPQNTITVQDAAVVFIRLLGYDVWAQAKGGYPAGYIQAATSLKFFNKVKSPLDSRLTFGDLWALAGWAMETSTAVSNYHLENGVITEEIIVDKSAPTLLEKNMGLTMYEAVIDSIEPETYSINVTIQDDGKDRDVKYGAGRELTLKASPAVNIVAYDKAPVNIWITDDDRLMYVNVQDGYEEVYGSVLSVNKDGDSNSGYNTSYIDEMVLWDNDTKYEVSEDGASFFWNENPYSGSIKLVDKYVRMVVKGKEFIAVETWDFKEGGIVTESSFKKISYKRADTTEAFSNLESYYKQVLILDGENRDMKELKPDTLVDYFVTPNRDTLILLASQKKHADVFESVTYDELQIGNLLIRRSKNVITHSSDAGYQTNNFDNLLGTRVAAYADAHGKVRYVVSKSEATSNSFIGYLIGLDKGKGLDAGNIAYIANLDDSTFPKTVYKVAKTLKAGSLSLDALSKNQDTRNAKCIYKFELNGNGELYSASKLSPYYGYTPDADGFVKAFYNKSAGAFPERGTDDMTYYTDMVDSKRLYFPIKQKLINVFERDGEVAFTNTTYSALQAKNPRQDAYFYFFGQPMSSEFDLILIECDLTKMGGTSSTAFGILESVRNIVDANGKAAQVLVIDGKSYTVAEDDAQAKNLSGNSIIYYNNLNKSFSNVDIDVFDVLKLSDDFYSWDTLESNLKQAGSTAQITLKKGTITKIDSRRIFLDDGGAYFTSGCKYGKWNAGTKTFETGEKEDFLEGREVIYLLNSASMVTFIFYMD